VPILFRKIGFTTPNSKLACVSKEDVMEITNCSLSSLNISSGVELGKALAMRYLGVSKNASESPLGISTSFE
jgi:hypothetical protein